jgi:hypothetical protein
MDDGFSLGLHESQPEGPAGAAETGGVENRGGLFFAGPPDMADDAGKIAENPCQSISFRISFSRVGRSDSLGAMASAGRWSV